MSHIVAFYIICAFNTSLIVVLQVTDWEEAEVGAQAVCKILRDWCVNIVGNVPQQDYVNVCGKSFIITVIHIPSQWWHFDKKMQKHWKYVKYYQQSHMLFKHNTYTSSAAYFQHSHENKFSHHFTKINGWKTSRERISQWCINTIFLFVFVF